MLFLVCMRLRRSSRPVRCHIFLSLHPLLPPPTHIPVSLCNLLGPTEPNCVESNRHQTGTPESSYNRRPHHSSQCFALEFGFFCPSSGFLSNFPPFCCSVSFCCIPRLSIDFSPRKCDTILCPKRSRSKKGDLNYDGTRPLVHQGGNDSLQHTDDIVTTEMNCRMFRQCFSIYLFHQISSAEIRGDNFFWRVMGDKGSQSIVKHWTPVCSAEPSLIFDVVSYLVVALP